MGTSPILDNKDADAPSIFAPAALLREARRQKGMAAGNVPSLCILDPDGDIVRRLPASFAGPGDIVDKTGPRFLKREIDAFLGQDRQTERDVGQRRRCRIRSKDGGRQLWAYDWRVFYPYYYTEEHREWDDFPDATARHHWTASWWKNGGI